MPRGRPLRRESFTCQTRSRTATSLAAPPPATRLVLFAVVWLTRVARLTRFAAAVRLARFATRFARPAAARLVRFAARLVRFAAARLVCIAAAWPVSFRFVRPASVTVHCAGELRGHC